MFFAKQLRHSHLQVGAWPFASMTHQPSDVGNTNVTVRPSPLAKVRRCLFIDLTQLTPDRSVQLHTSTLKVVADRGQWSASALRMRASVAFSRMCRRLQGRSRTPQSSNDRFRCKATSAAAAVHRSRWLFAWAVASVRLLDTHKAHVHSVLLTGSDS